MVPRASRSPAATTSTSPPPTAPGDPAARRRQHDRDRRQADGRDGRAPRRAHRHPAGHPGRRRRRRRRLREVRATSSSTPRSRSAPSRPSPRRSPLIPKRAHRAAVVVVDGRPVGVVAEADCLDVDRFAQAGQVMRPRRGRRSTPAPTRARPSTRSTPPARRSRSAVDADGALVGVLTRTGALRATLYAPAIDADGRLRVAAAVGVNGDVAAKTPRPARRRRRLPRRRHRPRPPGPDGRGAGRRPRRSTRRCRSSPATSCPPRAPARWSRPAPTSSRSASGRAPCARPG